MLFSLEKDWAKTRLKCLTHHNKSSRQKHKIHIDNITDTHVKVQLKHTEIKTPERLCTTQTGLSPVSLDWPNLRKNRLLFWGMWSQFHLTYKGIHMSLHWTCSKSGTCSLSLANEMHRVDSYIKLFLCQIITYHGNCNSRLSSSDVPNWCC